MARLNTDKLLKQCQRIAAQQQVAKEKRDDMPTEYSVAPTVVDMLEPAEMNAQEFSQYLTEFLRIMRQSNKRYDEAVRAEIYPNAATQDILHAIELAPSTIDFNSLVSTLHQLRASRREAKKELEVTTLIKDWYVRNEKAMNELQNVLGDVRKALGRQPSDMYKWKTDIIGREGDWLVIDKFEDEENPEETASLT